MKITFIGLGVMGYPMAGHLAQKSGAKICVYNRNQEKAKSWLAANPDHEMATSVAEAVKGADFVMMCVGDDPDVLAIALGHNGVLGDDGALAHMKQGAVLIDHTTASAQVARQVAQLAAQKGIGFLDAPVSGGQAGAENGALTVMCGGKPEFYEKAKPYLACYARASDLIGDTGAGQLAKMVNQICIAGVVQGLAEGINFGQKAGIDMDKTLAVISKGAASSWQMENRGATMVQGKFDFGFALDWMRKDLRICLETARQTGAQLPLTALVDQFYADLQARGKGRQDTSSLIERL